MNANTTMQTDQKTGKETLRVPGQAGPSAQEEGAEILRDLHGWYRRLVREERRAQRRGQWGRVNWKTKLWWLRQELRTPLIGWREARQMTRQFGELVARQYGVSLLRQMVEQLWLHVRYELPPASYYKYRLFIPRLRRKAGRFVHHDKIVRLHAALKKRLGSREPETLFDKRLFYEWCTAHALPTVPVLAAFEDETVEYFSRTDAKMPLPGGDLFSKNADRWGGERSGYWRYVGEGRYEGVRGEVVDQKGLVEQLHRHSRDGPVILQERLLNDERITGLSSGGLCTVHLVTGGPPGAAPRPLIASLRMPAGGSHVDNFAAGGLAAPIDLETGRLGTAVSQYPQPGPRRFAFHPDTCQLIEGFQLPQWRDILELGVRAHQTFSEVPFVGWDIALAKPGLLILEGNTGWGAGLIEIPHERPLTETAFQPYYDAWMRHCLSEAGRP